MNYFDYGYTTNCQEMIHGWDGAYGYLGEAYELWQGSFRQYIYSV